MTSLTNKFETVRLVYKNHTLAKDRPDASTPEQVYHLLKKEWEPGELDLIEEAKLLILDRSGCLMSIYHLAKGGMDWDDLTLDPKVIFAAALTRRAHQIILVQNYPGGKFEPRFLDLGPMNQITKAGRLLDIPLIDYMVFTTEGCYSLMRDGEIDISNGPHP